MIQNVPSGTQCEDGDPCFISICDGSGSCFNTGTPEGPDSDTDGTCDASDGDDDNDGVADGDDPCPLDALDECVPPAATGACCLIFDDACSIEMREDCEAAGGIYRGDGSDCTACDGEFDLLTTCPSFAQDTFIEFGAGPSTPPIPPGFFDPGSDPFVGLVTLGGQPIDELLYGNADTIVIRPPIISGPPVTVPIEIVALNLVSVQPITVTYSGGQNPEAWDVHVDLSVVPSPQGQLATNPTHLNGGTFDATLPVQARLMFVRQSDSATVVLDTGAIPMPPFQLAPLVFEFDDVPYVHDLDAVLEYLSQQPLGQTFVPFVDELVPGDESTQAAASETGVAPPQVGEPPPPIEAQHCVGPAAQKVCIYEVTCIAGAEPGDCTQCGLSLGHLVRGSTCPNKTCAGSISRTCGDSGCCVSYTFFDCGYYGDQTPMPPGDPCVCEPSCCDTDNSPPVIACPGDVTVECGLGATDPGNTGGEATAIDNCGVQSITFSDSSVPGRCPVKEVITRTWTATDICGLSSSCTQTITVIDLQPPLIAGCPGGATLECDMAIPPAPALIANDDCDGAIAATLDEQTTPGSCAQQYTITRTWTAADSCGNAATPCVQVIEVIDTTAPALAGVPGDVKISCNQALPAPPAVTALDNCDAAVMVTMTEVASSSPTCPQEGFITRTWTATDDCGNVAMGEQIIEFSDDEAPVLAGCPDDQVIECGEPIPPAANVTAVDNCDLAPVVTLDESTVDGSCEGELIITRTWTATDACGNSSSCTQEILVQDTTPPVATCPPDPAPSCQDDVPDAATTLGAFLAQGGTVSDACSDSFTFTLQNEFDNGGAGCSGDPLVITRIYQVTDDCDNTAKCTQTITVADVTGPAITCPADVTVSCIEDAAPGLPFGSVEGVVGIYYNDNSDGEVPTNQAYLRTQYSDVNSSGGQFTFSSIPLTGNGLTWSAIFNELGQYGFDMVLPVNPDGSVVPPVLTAVDNGDNTPGGAIPAGPVAWAINDYKDDAPNGPGNTKNAPTNSVIRAETPPILPGDIVITRNDVTESGGIYTAQIEGYLESDDVIHWYTIGQPDSPMAGFNLTGTFYFSGTLTYDVSTDPYPLIDFYQGTIEITANASGSDAGFATATDDCTPFPLVGFSDSTNGGSGCAGDPMIITRTWTATDACGNISSCEQVITVEDDEPPVFLSVPGDVEVNLEAGECSALVEIGQPLVTDNCGAPLLDPPTVSFVRSDGVPGLDDPYLPGMTTITWTATDGCGNEATTVTTVMVDAVDELEITVALQNVGAGPFTRCMHIELLACDGGEPHVIEQPMTFTGGTASAKLEIPCAPGSQWVCITVRDPLHTLRSTVESLSVSGQQYVASFTGGDALKGGNLNGPASNVIDIFDFGAFAGEFNESYGSENTDCDDAPPHADISGNGVVFVEDYTFIVNNFLDVSEADCCTSGGGGIAGGESDTPVLSISVAELVAMGLGSYAAGDLNGDGWLDLVDMQLFADGVWPTDDSEVRKVAFIGAPGSSWFDAGNWSDGLLPDANADVTIDVNVSIDGGDAVAGDIAINSDAVLSVNAASLSTAVITVHGGGMLMLNDPSASVSAQTLVISEGAMLAWNAGLIAADVFNSGLVDLGQPVAQLMLDGEFTQLPAGVLTIDIAGELDSLRDALIITGPANLDGTLEVHLLDEYVPPVGTKLDSVIEAQQITGMFAAVSPPTTLPAGTFQHLAISESAVHIIYSDQPLLPADLNSDGIIGAADLAELLAQWGVCPPPGGCSADFNADGVIDAADLAQILAAWSTE